ncbi:CrcB-like protein-domain-containing protein [Truncatella angustata]|uniref:CrcB-like protein-domain-containing protein n=1 Tax=Truncatella angustata TaxID=152316 RepID=A0A9P8UTC8_9PEZI|nr:CrcB-like protein-domain-containing protein [Truncatella angustata]KAH6658137.1 CrcB-like protein-domain-containing protein [Truncatella angustata]
MPQSHSTAAHNRSQESINYDVPSSYRNLDDAVDPEPVQDRDQGTLRQPISREDCHDKESEKVVEKQANERRSRHDIDHGPVGSRYRRQSASGVNYDVPDQYVNTAEVSSTGPVQNEDGTGQYQHQFLEDMRGRDQDYLQGRAQQHTAGPGASLSIEEVETRGKMEVSELATQIYTVSYLILFSILGTLARLGLQAITSYPGAPVTFSSVWPNFAGSLIFGFLAEDRKLFLHEWGTATYERQIRKAQRQADEEFGGPGSRAVEIDLAAAKKAHLATKKTIPMYIGLATGFCGSFTSFSSFIRDVFLALSNDLPSPGLGPATVPRHGGYSFEALVAVILATVSLSLGGLFVGAHLAIALERFTPSFPIRLTRNVIDRAAVFLGFGCWVGAVILSAVPPDRFSHGLGAAETWRGRATFALVFAPLGCLGRFYASLYLNGRVASFPLGTFAVNILGTAILGMAWDIAHVPDGGVIGCQVLQGIEDGFCGCLTTVSTWVSELAALRRKHAYTYGATSVVVALACMVAIMGGLRWSDGFAGLVCLH